MSDSVPKEHSCDTRQSEATARENIGQMSSMAARLGIMAPTSNATKVPPTACPSVTGANCAINSHPVSIHSSKSQAETPKCR